MIASILKHEIKNRFTHWTIFLFYGLLIFQGIWYTKGTFDYYVNEDLMMNAPAIFYRNLAGGGILLIIVVAVISAPFLFKEIQHKTGQWLFTNPIDEKKFFFSRFLAAFSINALIALGYVIGMLLVPYSGIGEAHRFGTAPIGQLIHGFVFLLLPNILLLGSLVFFALVFTRRSAAGFLAVILTVITFLLMQTTAETSGTTPFLMVAEPFGFVAVENAIAYMDVTERNFSYLKFTDYLIANRLLWTGFSLLLFFLAYRKFNFKYFLKPASAKKEITTNDSKAKTFSKLKEEYDLKEDYSFSTFLKKLLSLSVLEIKNITRPTGFKVIIGIVVLMNILQNLLWNDSYYIGNTEALTFTMTQFRLSYGVFIIILLMVLSGELFFKDRTVKFWQIADTLPIPIWTVTLSKFIAMTVVAFVLASVFALTGIGAQLVKGGASLIDLSLYVYDNLGYNWGWLTYVLHIALVFFIAGLLKNRIATHIVSVGYFFFVVLTFELGLAEQTIYAFGAVPGLEDYSEMSGYGIWKIAAKWYFLMWALLSVCFILLGIWFWQRGSNRNFKSSLFNHQLSWAGKIVLLVLFVGFVLTRLHILNEVNGKGNYVASADEVQEQANYEKKYSYIKELNQPKYSHVDLTFDFYPNERKAIYEYSIELSNPGNVDTLYLNWADFVQTDEITTSGQALKSVWSDEDLKIRAYLIPNEFKAEGVLSLKIKSQKQYSGFTQSGENPQPDLMFNGSYGSIKDFLPTIGYDYERELKENRKRADNGLVQLNSRMASVTDSIALEQDAYSPDADWITGKIQISTIESQTIIAPGELLKEWKTNSRNYYQFEINKAQPFNWFLGSSEYAIAEQTNDGIKTQVFFDKKHPFNVRLYQEAVSKTIGFIQNNFGEFPQMQVRIYEIPYYQTPFYSFPNGIAISEKEGWYAKTDKLNEKAYIYQTVASQVIKQWVNANIKIANVQGADMLKLALPEALAMTFIEQELGQEAVNIIFRKKKDKYAKDKNSEANQEPVLLYADGVDYLEQNKGAIVLYQTIQELGIDNFARALVVWTTNDNKHRTFKAFMDFLKPQLKAGTFSKLTTKQ